MAGKNKTYPLEQYDTISFFTLPKKVFVFLSNGKPKEELTSIPPQQGAACWAQGPSRPLT